MYKCEKCYIEFKYKYLLERHKNNKKPCDTRKKIDRIFDDNINKIKDDTNNITVDIENLDDKINKIDDKIRKKINESNKTEIKCSFCEKNFISKRNMTRHLEEICHIKKKLMYEKNKFIQEKNDLLYEINKLNGQKNKYDDNEKNELKDEIKKMREDIKKLLEKQFMNNTQNITINKNITNNNNNNNMTININSFGKESFDHITLDNYKRYLDGFFPGFINFIEKIHFDESAPQNHNLCITNLKSKFICVYDNGKWIVKDKDDIIDNLITKKYNLLGGKCEELEEAKQISEKTIKNFEEFCKNYNCEEAQKVTKNNISLMIYNNGYKITNKPKGLDKIKKNKIIDNTIEDIYISKDL